MLILVLQSFLEHLILRKENNKDINKGGYTSLLQQRKLVWLPQVSIVEQLFITRIRLLWCVISLPFEKIKN